MKEKSPLSKMPLQRHIFFFHYRGIFVSINSKKKAKGVCQTNPQFSSCKLVRVWNDAIITVPLQCNSSYNVIPFFCQTEPIVRIRVLYILYTIIYQRLDKTEEYHMDTVQRKREKLLKNWKRKILEKRKAA
jgi:hypothetical protein